MVSFWVYDVAFLVLFTLFIIVFLHKKRANLERQGILFLYKTKLGIKLMDWTVDKFRGFLKPLQYIVVASGFILMISMIWLLIKTVYLYMTSPIIIQLIRAPPIAPLIPYFPTLFNMESFFPQLYFTYFLIALVIVAVSHEFAHGIFARFYKIRIKTTGFAFLGPILGAFVEPDEKQMQKAKKFPQLTILAAGTFANVVMTVIFGLILGGFFALSFAPAGINFNTYGSEQINVDSINSINGQQINDISQIAGMLSDENLLIDISASSLEGTQKNYLIRENNLKFAIEASAEQITVFDDSPAARSGLRGPITQINGEKITSIKSLQNELNNYSPGDEIIVTTKQDGNVDNHELILGERNGQAYLGIGFLNSGRGGVIGWFMTNVVENVKDPFIYYESRWDGDFAWFIYYLLWWIVIINILVALFNMLPVSILDGGRFFYLSVWGITGSEKIGKKAFAFATWFIVALLILMMVRWAISFF
ncbi:hypothetical protein COU60_00475 [Candidatus Pacearchaeota archaeon CG10_big_fil_rev_8_21_14_0_10_34_76]|nr:MAG: hypothetical protein COU60_00475 [Candidatus Pacearchaeota archaeon CG10_big_fil_rev_8_21_14_0_10_34_76]